MKVIRFTYIIVLILFIPLTGGTTGTNRTIVRNNIHRSFLLRDRLNGSGQIYLPLIHKAREAYYVSPLGNDSYPGTFLLPWRTLAKAVSSLVAGDTLYVRSGIYHERVRIDHSGTQRLPIQMLAYPGENPIIDGENQLPGEGEGLLSLHGDWVVVEGLEIQNSSYWGIVLYGQHNVIVNVFVHHSNRAGILISGDYGTVQDSRVWWNSTMNVYGQIGYGSPGITAARDSIDGLTEYGIIRKNVVWENWGEGISTFEADHTFIEDNISHDNFVANIYISDATNIICQRNFVYINPSSTMYGYGEKVGVMLGDETYDPASVNIQVINNIGYGNHVNFFWWQGVQGGGMNNVLIANNTFVNSIGNASVGDANVIINSGDHINVRIQNNLVRQDGNLPVIDTINHPGLVFSNNLWSKPPDVDASGPGDIIGAPSLVEIGSPFTPGWFRLLEISPAIDHAIYLPEVLVDIFGNQRDTYPDIGAVEYIP